MTKKSTAVLICVISLIAFIAMGVFIILSERVKMNPAGTVGNTAGNINNAGLFCEYNGKVYFSNAFDGGSLFVMNPDETGLQRLLPLNVRNILAGGDYLYYFQIGSSSSEDAMVQLSGIRSFQRYSLNSKKTKSLTTDTVVSGQLVDNYLYLLTSTKSGPSFFKLKIDASDRVSLADYAINPACAENGVIYYNNTQNDHYLFSLDTKTDVPNELWRGNLWYPVKEGDYIYYMDVANNYRLCRYSLSQNVIEVLTNDRVDCFNVGGGFIYYQKNGRDAQLKAMYTNGGSAWVIAEGNYTNINMTSGYVYFQDFGDDTIWYHSPLGSGSYSRFDAAASYN